jgi:hypothetical protein
MCFVSLLLAAGLGTALYFLRNQLEKQKQTEQEAQVLRDRLKESGAWGVYETQQKLIELDKKKEESLQGLSELEKKEADLQQKLTAMRDEVAQSEKTVASNGNKVLKLQTALKSMQYAVKRYSEDESLYNEVTKEGAVAETEELLSTTIKLKLHLMDIRELRKLYNQNNKLIQELLKKYQGRYTTKANAAIYQLMVIALEAELQNVLYNLSYSKLDKAIKDVKTITSKYEKIATDGNQSIASTVTKFIGEIEYLFIELVKIEYEYYIQKERIKEEQKALRDQMKQEAAEQKALEEERKKIEKEESKYITEMSNIKEQMANTDDPVKSKQLEERMAKVQAQLDEVEKKKDQIVNLQSGKAGYIYVISNLGSFGENVFKVGMTRRLVPQERVDELGDASVPFKFDIHSLIFSDNAPELENQIHKKLHSQRVNKINLKKEFFKTSIDELEGLVYSLEPSAEFNRTMMAEQYYQSMAVDVIPETVTIVEEGSAYDDE